MYRAALFFSLPVAFAIDYCVAAVELQSEPACAQYGQFGCSWDATAGQCKGLCDVVMSCQIYGTSADACGVGSYGCTWNNVSSTCEGAVTYFDSCGDYSATSECSLGAMYGCSWNGGTSVCEGDFAIPDLQKCSGWGYLNATSCNAAEAYGCEWDATTSVCDGNFNFDVSTRNTCDWPTMKLSCESWPDCLWDSTTSTCSGTKRTVQTCASPLGLQSNNDSTSQLYAKFFCDASVTYGCEWNAITSECLGEYSYCPIFGAQCICELTPGCSWGGGACSGVSTGLPQVGEGGEPGGPGGKDTSGAAVASAASVAVMAAVIPLL